MSHEFNPRVPGTLGTRRKLAPESHYLAYTHVGASKAPPLLPPHKYIKRKTIKRNHGARAQFLNRFLPFPRCGRVGGHSHRPPRGSCCPSQANSTVWPRKTRVFSRRRRHLGTFTKGKQVLPAPPSRAGWKLGELLSQLTLYKAHLTILSSERRKGSLET